MTRGAVYGFALGLLFPIVSTGIVIVSHDLHPTAGTVLHLHASEPLLQVIDAVPFILALAFMLVGRGRAELDAVIVKLEGQVTQRTAVMTAARKSAEQDDRKRSLLLTRLYDVMGRRLEGQLRAGAGSVDPDVLRSVRDITQRLADLSRLEAGELAVTEETFDPQRLVDGLEDLDEDLMHTGVALRCRLEDEVPGSIGADPKLVAATLEQAVRLIGELALGGTTVVTIRLQPGALGSKDRLHIVCRNERVMGSSTTIRKILDHEEVVSKNVVRELVGITLRSYAEAIGAELAIRTSEEEGTLITILVPITTPQAEKATAPASAILEASPT